MFISGHVLAINGQSNGPQVETWMSRNLQRRAPQNVFMLVFSASMVRRLLTNRMQRELPRCVVSIMRGDFYFG